MVFEKCEHGLATRKTEKKVSPETLRVKGASAYSDAIAHVFVDGFFTEITTVEEHDRI